MHATRAVHPTHRLMHMLTLEVRHLLQELIRHSPLILKVLVEDCCQDQLLPVTRVVYPIHCHLLHMLTRGHLVQELICYSHLIIS